MLFVIFTVAVLRRKRDLIGKFLRLLLCRTVTGIGNGYGIIQLIREELYESGYASRMKNQPKSKKKQYRPMEFVTDEGFRVLCGKNNLQNEYITHQLAQRHDWWFHVKNAPGSHVILCCEGKEPGEKSFTQAAMIAAYYAKRGEAKHIAVDYTQVYQLKKVPGARPGMVIYHSNYSAYVTPDEQAVLRLRIKD